MKQKLLLAGVAALVFVAAGAAGATTIVVPDPGAAQYTSYGSGDASVTIGGVDFVQSGALSDGNFYDVGSQFSGSPAVLSSQQQSFGVANIDIEFATAIDSISIDYGTFNGSDVTFALSNGKTVTQASDAAAYGTPDVFTFTSPTPFTSVLVTSTDSVMNINNITYGVPEPTTWALMLVGVGGVGGALRSARRKSAETMAA